MMETLLEILISPKKPYPTVHGNSDNLQTKCFAISCRGVVKRDVYEHTFVAKTYPCSCIYPLTQYQVASHCIDIVIKRLSLIISGNCDLITHGVHKRS